MHLIAVPVADLRKKPEQLTQDYSHHPLRDSQLLFQEKIEVVRKEGNWAYIQALEQMQYDQEKGWRPYEGWIHVSEMREERLVFPPNVVVTALTTLIKPQNLSLSFGTYLHQREDGAIQLSASERGFVFPLDIGPLEGSFNREKLIQDGSKFLGLPYLWGGRGGNVKGAISSVDCSGLIDLVYRAQGIAIPRDAHDQYLASIPTRSPQKGDAIFLCREFQKERISHVLLYDTERRALEAPETGKCVRSLEWGKEIWIEGGFFHFFDRPHRYHYFFRTFQDVGPSHLTI